MNGKIYSRFYFSKYLTISINKREIYTFGKFAKKGWGQQSLMDLFNWYFMDLIDIKQIKYFEVAQLRAVHRPQSGGFIKCGQGGYSDADVRNFWHKKHRVFEIYGVFARTRRRGSIFRNFVRTSFIDGPFEKV